jgi:hypothetical protein
MNSVKSVEFSLAHRLDVSRIAEYLVRGLECEGWYVVCHREHQFVIHLTHAGTDRYAASFECSPPAEKGIYHGSTTTRFRVIALGDQVDIAQTRIDEIRAGLAHLAHAAAVHAG